ncbi:hypothetical protein AVEN_15645-1 [Araneus ventricosus]|uniref:Uncharacterized protein n=1 Tax=Araneus ventricosus TaxID=182803 RepID=A0A4Y2RF66_ARAVE|nr:hypothetical protein AVEN_15645-1 [Araneus ventricosus]
MYWSMKKLGRRSQYSCTINEVSGKPEFCIQVKDVDQKELDLKEKSAKEYDIVYAHIINYVHKESFKSIGALLPHNPGRPWPWALPLVIHSTSYVSSLSFAPLFPQSYSGGQRKVWGGCP